MRRIPKWIFVAAPLGFLVFMAIGGEVVMLLWNWLLPELFGWRQVTFWQALGLLALCRILFGGFGLNGGGSHRSRHRRDEHWGLMSPAERERLSQGLHERPGSTTPLNAQPGA